MRPRPSPALRGAALALFALFLAVSLPTAAVRSAKRIAQAVGLAGERAGAARRRVLGNGWVEQVELIRRAIPPGEAYFLVDATREEEGGAYWVRYELAPRRALFLGKVTELPPPSQVAAATDGGPPWVVVALRDREPPLLFPRDAFLRVLSKLELARPRRAAAGRAGWPHPPERELVAWRGNSLPSSLAFRVPGWAVPPRNTLWRSSPARLVRSADRSAISPASFPDWLPELRAAGREERPDGAA